MPGRVVIIGAGQAGYQAAASLRAEGWDGSITLIGEEPGLPYQRPPLSKAFLAGKQEARHTELRPESFYKKESIELRAGERAAAIDRNAKQVLLAAGGSVRYDTLILATGARNRELKVPGSSQSHVYYLRTLAEATELRSRIVSANSIAVVGGGFIGLEVAAVARGLGKPVVVIEAQPRLMARVVAPVVSDYFRATHESHGVEFRLNTSVLAVAPQGVLTSDGGAPAAELVVIGIGIVPNLELAREAGLATANGISVDEFLRTSDPDIFAIGDCAEYPNAYTGTRVRLESVQNAVDQAIAVAKTVTGNAAAYDSAPWFWTDQYDIRLQMAGLAPTWDQTVLRGATESRKLSVFYFNRSQLLAVDSINRPADHLAARKLIGNRIQITPEQAADETFDLKRAAAAV